MISCKDDSFNEAAPIGKSDKIADLTVTANGPTVTAKEEKKHAAIKKYIVWRLDGERPPE
jgi:hypothetical protein